jgi:phosphoribosylpyrophosphate synthetase
MDNLKKDIIGTHFKGYEHIDQKIKWDRFPDGTPKNQFDKPDNIKGADVFFIADLEKTENVFNQLSVIYAIPHYGAKSLTVFIPYFPTATMERVGEPGQIATAKTLMRMLDAIPHCHGSGPARIIIYDIHSLAVQHFHNDGIIIELQSAIPFFLQYLKTESTVLFPDDSSLGKEKIVFAFPDDGARKRFHTFFPDPCIICTKDENRKVTIKEGHELVDGNHVVIIDDMVRNGDTLLNCGKEIRHYGASAVSAYVTHGVFPEKSWKKFYTWTSYNSNWLPDKAIFKKFWFTDSCRVVRDLKQERLLPNTFDVISLAPLIVEDIKK